MLPFGHSTQTSQTERQTYRPRQRSDSIVRAGLQTVAQKSVHFLSLLLETLEQNGSRTGQKSGERERSGELVWQKMVGAGAGVTEIGLSDERKFCRSRCAHMLW